MPLAAEGEIIVNPTEEGHPGTLGKRGSARFTRAKGSELDEGFKDHHED
jgi:hypothetical protein